MVNMALGVPHESDTYIFWYHTYIYIYMYITYIVILSCRWCSVNDIAIAERYYYQMELPPVQNQHLKELPRNEKAASMTQVPWNKNYRRSPFWLGRSSINGHQWPQFSVPGTNQRRSEDWNTTNLCSLQTHIHIYEHIYIYIYTHTP